MKTTLQIKIEILQAKCNHRCNFVVEKLMHFSSINYSFSIYNTPLEAITKKQLLL